MLSSMLTESQILTYNAWLCYIEAYHDADAFSILFCYKIIFAYEWRSLNGYVPFLVRQIITKIFCCSYSAPLDMHCYLGVAYPFSCPFSLLNLGMIMNHVLKLLLLWQTLIYVFNCFNTRKKTKRNKMVFVSPETTSLLVRVTVRAYIWTPDTYLGRIHLNIFILVIVSLLSISLHFLI